MKHPWEVIDVDSGHLGTNPMWVCRRCGLNGGPAWPLKGAAQEHPFGEGPGRPGFISGDVAYDFSEDCDVAVGQILNTLDTLSIEKQRRSVLALSQNRKHFISASTGQEFCSVCRMLEVQTPATHKIGEEIMHDDPNPNRHNLTAYVCCTHFTDLLGRATGCLETLELP